MVKDTLPDRAKPAAAPEDPAQIAVALDSDRSGRHAPRVIAKGRGALAEQILEIASTAASRCAPMPTWRKY